MDALSVDLNETKIGARIGNTFCNHLIYADDVCLITTTLQAMNRLLSICKSYADRHNLEFNPNKTELQCYVPKFLHSVKHAINIRFQDAILAHKIVIKYLGYSVGCKVKSKKVILSDETEIANRNRELYMRANMLRSNFYACSPEVKRKLFNTFFSSIYCSSLWLYDVKKHDPIRVAYNNALRIIFNLKRSCSASEAFVSRRIGNFDFVLRKSAFSMKTRISDSDNVIINTIKCYLFETNECELARIWNNLLFVKDIHTS
jgi:hypothetical protein